MLHKRVISLASTKNQLYFLKPTPHWAPYCAFFSTINIKLCRFGVLLLFVVVGVLASAFLCITLKKDAYLWEAEREGQMQERESIRCDSQRDRDKEEDNTTQI